MGLAVKLTSRVRGRLLGRPEEYEVGRNSLRATATKLQIISANGFSNTQLIRQAQRYLADDGKINLAEAKALIALAKKDGKVTNPEPGDLATILDDLKRRWPSERSRATQARRVDRQVQVVDQPIGEPALHHGHHRVEDGEKHGLNQERLAGPHHALVLPRVTSYDLQETNLQTAIGNLYLNHGEPEKAIEVCSRGLAICEHSTVNLENKCAMLLGNLATAY